MYLRGAVLSVIGPQIAREGPSREQGSELPVEEEGEHVGRGDAQPAVQVKGGDPAAVLVCICI